MRISELSSAPNEIRKTFWLEELGLPLRWVSLSPEEGVEPSRLLVSSAFDGILISTEQSASLYEEATRKPAEVIEAGMADSLVREQGQLWLRCFVRHSLRSLIVSKAPQLDTHAIAYITGSGPLARMCAAVAIQMGFRRLSIVTGHQELAEETFHKLQKLFFDLEISVLTEAELTLQPNNGSILFNTENTNSQEISFEEILYFNFLRKEGLTIDFSTVEPGQDLNAIVKETLHVGMKLLMGAEIWGLRDYLFLQTLLKSNLKLSQDEYLKRWTAKFVSEIET